MNTPNIETSDTLIQRVLNAKPKLFEAIYPVTTYMPFVLQFFPNEDRDAWYKVLNFRKADAEITEKLEKLPELIKNQKAA
jgi:hypothetical protein